MATDIIARAMAARALKIAEEGGGTGEQFGLQSIEIDKNGNLVVTFTDGTVSNLGRVVGVDGKVYVPHSKSQHLFKIRKHFFHQSQEK